MSDYTNGWSKLAGVKEDVIEVQRALEDNGFEVQLLEDPDKQKLEATIEDFIFEKGANVGTYRPKLSTRGHEQDHSWL